MKNVLFVLFTVLAVAGIGGSVYFFMQYNTTKSEKEVLVKQNGELQSAIDAIGPVSVVWTVKADMFPGKEIKPDDLVEQTMPVASINENHILKKEQLVGNYYKVSVKPGTSLTKDIVMENEMSETTYERDITFSYVPLGLRVGDYVDMRIVLPYGEEFIIIKHERVEKIVDNTIKVRFDESQLALWTSALTDLLMYKNKGLGIYVTKYVEPGIHTPAKPFYPVRKEMESVVTLNPNIKNKKLCINTKIRDEIELKLKAVSDEDAGNISSGRTQEASDINTAKEMYLENGGANEISGDVATTTPKSSPTPGKPQNSSDPTIQDELDSLEEVGDSVPLDATDSQGNSSNVTNDQVNKSEGGDVFNGEGSIN